MCRRFSGPSYFAIESFCVDNEDNSKPPSANAREDALALEKKAGSTLEEEGHGEAHGAICPDQVDLVPGGIQEEGWLDDCEIEHCAEGGHSLQKGLKTAHL